MAEKQVMSLSVNDAIKFVATVVVSGCNGTSISYGAIRNGHNWNPHIIIDEKIQFCIVEESFDTEPKADSFALSLIENVHKEYCQSNCKSKGTHREENHIC